MAYGLWHMAYGGPMTEDRRRMTILYLRSSILHPRLYAALYAMRHASILDPPSSVSLCPPCLCGEYLCMAYGLWHIAYGLSLLPSLVLRHALCAHATRHASILYPLSSILDPPSSALRHPLCVLSSSFCAPQWSRGQQCLHRYAGGGRQNFCRFISGNGTAEVVPLPQVTAKLP